MLNLSVTLDIVYGDHDDDNNCYNNDDDDYDDYDDVNVDSLKRKGWFKILITNNLKSPFLNVYRKIRNELALKLLKV